MLVFAYIIAGLISGSFASALCWRLHESKNWVSGRSQCPVCGHQLAAIDLVPIFSYLALRGRCRYCQAKISPSYILVELLAAAWFGLSYVFWPTSLASAGQITLFSTWLVTSIGLIALALYDLRWMILPSKIIYPFLVVAAAGQAVYSLAFAPQPSRAMLAWLVSVAVASGLFFALNIASRGKWIGFGDVRLGLITGTVLADPAKAVFMIIVASLLGIIYGFGRIVARQKSFSDRIPYGPFLILGTLIALLFGGHIINWYLSLINH